MDAIAVVGLIGIIVIGGYFFLRTARLWDDGDDGGDGGGGM